MRIAVCVYEWAHDWHLCKRDGEHVIYPDCPGRVGHTPHERFLEPERDLGHAHQLSPNMKRGCSHRWRDIWAGHAGLRPSAIAHAYSKEGSGAVEGTRPKPLAKGSPPPAFLLRAKGNRFGADIRGATAVEFAFIASPLILMVLGIVDGGRMLWTQNSLQYAVEQAARYAVTSCTTTCATAAQIQSYAASKAYGMTISASDFASNIVGCGALPGTQVTASVPYTPLFPYPRNLTLTASSCRPT
jgi:Flp pilus assembly pilin Flp